MELVNVSWREKSCVRKDLTGEILIVEMSYLSQDREMGAKVRFVLSK